MAERPRILALDLLESYARERELQVLLARLRHHDEWTCVLTSGETLEPVTGAGRSAREAILSALRQEGVDLPG